MQQNMQTKYKFYYEYFMYAMQFNICIDVRYLIFDKMFKLHNRNLIEKNLSNCDLSPYIENNGDYSYFDMTKSIAHRLTFGNVLLNNAKLLDTIIINCDFFQTSTDTYINSPCSPYYCISLTNAQITECSFHNICFSTIILDTNTKFTKCKFTKAIFYNVTALRFV